jgi:hypothetical protein
VGGAWPTSQKQFNVTRHNISGPADRPECLQKGRCMLVVSTCAQEVGRAAVWIASSSTPALDDIHNS